MADERGEDGIAGDREDGKDADRAEDWYEVDGGEDGQGDLGGASGEDDGEEIDGTIVGCRQGNFRGNGGFLLEGVQGNSSGTSHRCLLLPPTK